MSIRLSLTILTCFISTFIFSQEFKYNTTIPTRIDWGNKVNFKYKSLIHDDRLMQNLSILNKFDSQIIENNHLSFIYFIVTNLLNGKFKEYNRDRGTEISLDQIKKNLTWNYTINYDHGDTIRKIYYEDFKHLELHQEWIIDTANQIKNRLTGISLIRYDIGEKRVIVHIPLDNKFISSHSLLNNDSIIYCRELRSSHKMEKFPKQKVMQLFANKINTLKSSSLSEGRTDIEMFNQNFTGIRIKQYLYFSEELNTLNTGLINIGPIVPILDEDGTLLFNITSFWLYP